jgi:hypothetical protein
MLLVAIAMVTTSAPPSGAETGANGKLTVTPASNLTPGGTITTTGVTGTPTVTISVANATPFWRVGTCPGAVTPGTADPFPPVDGRDCDLEGWRGAGATGDGAGSLVISLLPYVCGVGPVVSVIGPSTQPVNSGGKVALALFEGPGAFPPVTDIVELSYDCGPEVGPTLSIAGASVVEGDAGKARSIRFAVTLSEPYATGMTVDYEIVGTGSASASDVAMKTGTLTFNPALSNGLTPTIRYVTAKVSPDVESEGDETFEVRLSNPSTGHSVQTIATGTIIDDDNQGPSLRVSVSDAEILEGDRGKTDKATNGGKVVVNLSAPTTSEVRVTITVSAGGATAGTDFKKAYTKTLIFKPGQYQKFASVPIIPDLESEPDETVTLTLSNATGGATVGRTSGTLTVLDDD